MNPHPNPGPGRYSNRESVPASGDRVLLEIGPSGATYWRGLATRALVMVPLIIIGFLPRDGSELPAGVRWSIIGAGAVIAAVAIALMTTRVQLTPTAIRTRRLIGVQRIVPRQQISYGVLVQNYQQFANMTAPKLLLVDGNRHRLLHLTGQLFSAADLYGLAQGIGLQVFDVIPGPTNARGLDKRHPKLLPLTERRPFLLALIIVVLIVVVVVAVVVATES